MKRILSIIVVFIIVVFGTFLFKYFNKEKKETNLESAVVIDNGHFYTDRSLPYSLTYFQGIVEDYGESNGIDYVIIKYPNEKNEIVETKFLLKASLENWPIKELDLGNVDENSYNQFVKDWIENIVSYKNLTDLWKPEEYLHSTLEEMKTDFPKNSGLSFVMFSEFKSELLDGDFCVKSFGIEKCALLRMLNKLSPSYAEFFASGNIPHEEIIVPAAIIFESESL